MGGVFLLLSKISFYGTTLILVILILVLSLKFNKKIEDKINDEVSNEYIASYFDGEYQNEIPGKDDGYVADKIVCDNGATATWNNEEWGIDIRNATEKIKCSIYFKYQFEQEFDYTGTEQVFIVPKTGTYKLETWGAQGGSSGNKDDTGGFGGYSTGTILLTTSSKIYVYVGGLGDSGTSGDNGTEQTGATGGYNGGGRGGNGKTISGGGGGGATHISQTSGYLKELHDNIQDIFIVSGGGGGGSSWGSPGSGGGFKGSNTLDAKDQYGTIFPYKAIGGSADNDVINFGYGADAPNRTEYHSWGAEGKGGGGAGFYGGGTLAEEGEHTDCAGAGGSGYIGNSLLTNKSMYCYNCEESSEENTKTISTTCVEETPIENCAKKGNGYAKLIYVG